MRNLVFVIWMIGWPLANAIIDKLCNWEPGGAPMLFMIRIIIWIWIGIKLYEKEPEQGKEEESK